MRFKKIKLFFIFTVLLLPFYSTSIKSASAYTVAADITGYMNTESKCEKGESCRIEVRFKNTGDITWSFGVGASLRKPNGTVVDLPLKKKVAYSGDTAIVYWNYTYNTIGKWDLILSIWEQNTDPLPSGANRLANTGWMYDYVTVSEAPEPTISATINSKSGTDRICEVGESCDIALRFTNNGDTTWIFGVGATLKTPNGNEVDLPLKSKSLSPGQDGIVSWEYDYNIKGDWDLIMSVWKESREPLSNRLANTGWLYNYIEINEPEIADNIATEITHTTDTDRNCVVGEICQIKLRFTNTGNVSWTYGVGATLRKPNGVEIDLPLQTKALSVGNYAWVEWDFEYDIVGEWDLIMSVWKESNDPLFNRLANTGWLNNYIIVNESEVVENIAAEITHTTNTNRSCERGETCQISLRFTNTGNTNWIFGVGATLRKPNGIEVDLPLQAKTVNVGNYVWVEWDYEYDVAGDWDLRVSVWKESSEPLVNRLSDIGWLNNYIVVTDLSPEPIIEPEPNLVYVDIDNDEINVGELITVTVKAKNIGGASEEGAINASVLYSDGSDDLSIENVSATWADTIIKRKLGEAPLYNKYCNSISGGAKDHVIEAVDTNWNKNEEHILTFKIKPQKAGTLWVKVRATMKGEGACEYYNDTSVNGGVNDTDQQFWVVKKYSIKINKVGDASLISPFNINYKDLDYEFEGRLLSDGNLVSGDGGIKVSLFGPDNEINIGETHIFSIQLETGQLNGWYGSDGSLYRPQSIYGMGISQLMLLFDSEDIEIGYPMLSIDGKVFAQEYTEGLFNLATLGPSTSIKNIIYSAIGFIIDSTSINSIYKGIKPSNHIDFDIPQDFIDSNKSNMLKIIFGGISFKDYSTIKKIKLDIPIKFKNLGKHSITWIPDVRAEVYKDSSQLITTSGLVTGIEFRRQLNIEIDVQKNDNNDYAPQNVRFSKKNDKVYLAWDPPLKSVENIIYKIVVSDENNNLITLSTEIKENEVIIDNIPDNSSFQIIGIVSEKKYFSDLAYEVQSFIRKSPILLIPGMGGKADAWDDMKKKLENSGLKFGGEINEDSKLGDIILGDFYTCNYSDPGSPIASNTKPTKKFVDLIKDKFDEVNKFNSVNTKITLVGQSLGGLRARTYVQTSDKNEKVVDKIERLVTIGTPNRGVLKDRAKYEENYNIKGVWQILLGNIEENTKDLWAVACNPIKGLYCGYGNDCTIGYRAEGGYINDFERYNDGRIVCDEKTAVSALAQALSFAGWDFEDKALTEDVLWGSAFMESLNCPITGSCNKVSYDFNDLPDELVYRYVIGLKADGEFTEWQFSYKKFLDSIKNNIGKFFFFGPKLKDSSWYNKFLFGTNGGDGFVSNESQDLSLIHYSTNVKNIYRYGINHLEELEDIEGLLMALDVPIIDYGIASVVVKGTGIIVINNKKMYNRTKGYIILKVEDYGKAYYVNPAFESMYYLGRPDDAFTIMREQGAGISNQDLQKIPVADNYCPPYLTTCDYPGAYNTSFAGKHSGKIFLQVENNGEAWYVNPADNTRYFLGRPADAFKVMRNLSLGISNHDFDSLK